MDNEEYDILRDAEEIALRAMTEPEDRNLTPVERTSYAANLTDDLLTTLKRIRTYRQKIELAALTQVTAEFTIKAGRQNFEFIIPTVKGIREFTMSSEKGEGHVRLSVPPDQTPLGFIDFTPKEGVPQVSKLHGYFKIRDMIGEFKRVIGI